MISPDTWDPADYDYDAQLITGINQSNAIAQALVPGIKLLKAFLRNQSIGLKSFHIEVLCALVLPSALSDWQARNLNWGYQHLLAHFLKNVRTHLTGPVSLPGSHSPAIDSGVGFLRLQQIGTALESLGETAWKVCELDDKQHNTSSALDYWRKFFGEPFPS